MGGGAWPEDEAGGLAVTKNLDCFFGEVNGGPAVQYISVWKVNIMLCYLEKNLPSL